MKKLLIIGILFLKILNVYALPKSPENLKKLEEGFILLRIWFETVKEFPFM